MKLTFSRDYLFLMVENMPFVVEEVFKMVIVLIPLAILSTSPGATVTKGPVVVLPL